MPAGLNIASNSNVNVTGNHFGSVLIATGAGVMFFEANFIQGTVTTSGTYSGAITFIGNRFQDTATLSALGGAGGLAGARIHGNSFNNGVTLPDRVSFVGNYVVGDMALAASVLQSAFFEANTFIDDCSLVTSSAAASLHFKNNVVFGNVTGSFTSGSKVSIEGNHLYQTAGLTLTNITNFDFNFVGGALTASGGSATATATGNTITGAASFTSFRVSGSSFGNDVTLVNSSLLGSKVGSSTSHSVLVAGRCSVEANNVAGSIENAESVGNPVDVTITGNHCTQIAVTGTGSDYFLKATITGNVCSSMDVGAPSVITGNTLQGAIVVNAYSRALSDGEVDSGTPSVLVSGGASFTSADVGRVVLIHDIASGEHLEGFYRITDVLSTSEVYVTDLNGAEVTWQTSAGTLTFVIMDDEVILSGNKAGGLTCAGQHLFALTLIGNRLSDTSDTTREMAAHRITISNNRIDTSFHIFATWLNCSGNYFHHDLTGSVAIPYHFRSTSDRNSAAQYHEVPATNFNFAEKESGRFVINNNQFIGNVQFSDQYSELGIRSLQVEGNSFTAHNTVPFYVDCDIREFAHFQNNTFHCHVWTANDANFVAHTFLPSCLYLFSNGGLTGHVSIQGNTFVQTNNGNGGTFVSTISGALLTVSGGATSVRVSGNTFQKPASVTGNGFTWSWNEAVFTGQTSTKTYLVDANLFLSNGDGTVAANVASIASPAPVNPPTTITWQDLYRGGRAVWVTASTVTITGS
jgi:hypothetical protein